MHTAHYRTRADKFIVLSLAFIAFSAAARADDAEENYSAKSFREAREDQQRQERQAAGERLKAGLASQARTAAYNRRQVQVRATQLETYRGDRGTSPQAAFELCRIALGIHPDFPAAEADVAPLVTDDCALEIVTYELKRGNPLLIEYLWQSMVSETIRPEWIARAKQPHWWRALSAPEGKPGHAPHAAKLGRDASLLLAGIADRVLTCPTLQNRQVVALKNWQSLITQCLRDHPEYAPALLEQLGEKLPTRLLGDFDVRMDGTGEDSKRLTSCLGAYLTLHKMCPGFPGEAKSTRLAATYAHAATDPLLINSVYAISGDAKYLPQLRKNLADKSPSAKWLRQALAHATAIPVLAAQRAGDPDLTSAGGAELNLPRCIALLAGELIPFEPADDNDDVVRTLADLAQRSASRGRITQAIPVLTEKARRFHCQRLAGQLAIIDTGLMLRGDVEVADLPRLRIGTVANDPSNTIPYDTLLAFSPAQAADSMKRPATREAVREVLLALAGQGSIKAADALKLAGETPPLGANPTTAPGDRPTELPF